MELDLSFIRRQFPSLRDDYIYFDNAGGSQTLKRVMDKITEYYMTSDVQLGGAYSVSLKARERVNKGTAQIATTLNAEHTNEVIVGSSSTALIRLFSIVIGRTLNPGDEIIVTNCDHEANISAWKDLKKQGVVIKIWEFDTTSLQLELKDLKPLISDKTKLVAFCHVSNIFGTIHPVKKITEFIHSHGVQVFVDGVAYAPHRLVDVQDLNVDFYVYSIYKVFGPHLGVLYGKKKHLLKLPGINHNFIAADDIPYKFQPGGPNYELTYSLCGILDYYKAVAQHHGMLATETLRKQMQYAFNLFDKHEEKLTKVLLDYLSAKQNIRIIGDTGSDVKFRVSTVSFIVNNTKSSEIDAKIHPHKIGIKTGDFYAKGITKSLDLDRIGGVIRVSMAHYNTLKEVNRLISIFETIL
ncbi:MAG: aminotransferase class V-fold PLP-dependent enzyme [Saprospiraceae bacterium]|nr:aminotransferase class V-fold PLP-dependent enzyme [Saprospiraceae bacterium]